MPPGQLADLGFVISPYHGSHAFLKRKFFPGCSLHITVGPLGAFALVDVAFTAHAER
jgi:hypothetical protein